MQQFQREFSGFSHSTLKRPPSHVYKQAESTHQLVSHYSVHTSFFPRIIRFDEGRYYCFPLSTLPQMHHQRCSVGIFEGVSAHE